MDPNVLSGTLVDDRFVLENCLGTGAYGAVFAALEVLGGEPIARCALKFCRPQNNAEEDALLRELRLMARLSHSRILAYRGSGVVSSGPLEGCIYIAMECAQESLYSYLERCGPLDHPAALDLVADISLALTYLHELGVVHLDVTPDNIMRVHNAWKLGDFGLSRTLAELRGELPLYGGTVPYMAPEILQGLVGPPVDVWALGIVTQESLTLKVPFPVATLEELEAVISRNPVIAEFSAPFSAVIHGALRRSPVVRITAAEMRELLSGWLK